MNRVRILFAKLFGKYLLVTNVATNSLMTTVGDVIEQHSPWNKHADKNDWHRTRVIFWVSLCLGPPQHFFYKFLDSKFSSKGVKNVTKKVLVEQLTASPLYIIAFFIAYGLIDDKLSSCMQELKQKYWNIYMIDCAVWPASQFVNFLFCNPKYRMLYVSFSNMMYGIFLSFAKHEMNSGEL